MTVTYNAKFSIIQSSVALIGQTLISCGYYSENSDGLRNDSITNKVRFFSQNSPEWTTTETTATTTQPQHAVISECMSKTVVGICVSGADDSTYLCLQSRSVYIYSFQMTVFSSIPDTICVTKRAALAKREICGICRLFSRCWRCWHWWD